jgi:GEVED domain
MITPQPSETLNHPAPIMKKTILALATYALGLFAANAQQPNPPPPGGSYNPYLVQGFVAPAPMLPVEFNGTGTLTFDVGNTGSSDIVWVANQSMLVTLSLSYGVPNVADPNDPVQAITAVTGPGAAFFSWEYFPAQKTFRGTQKATIPGGARETINIAYKVAQNSFITESYKNGFNSNISPPGYTNPQPTDDDTVAAYTYVQAFDYSDAPATYGSSRHEIDLTKQLVPDPNDANLEIEVYNRLISLGALIDPENAAQPNVNALGDDSNQTGGLNIDDEDGVTIPSMSPGVATTINYSVSVVDEDYFSATLRFNGWIDWNHDGDFLDAGERVANNVVLGSSGNYNLNVTPPITAVPGPTFARFRIGPSVTSPTINAAYGEVEDYMFTTNGPTGIVTGKLYIDTNGNGTQDVGEPNLPNVDVIITDSASGVQTVTTDSNGNWTATVPTGSTSIDIDNTDPQYPTGYTQTEGNDPTVVTVLINQSNNGGVDGFFLPASIAGITQVDTNSDDIGDLTLNNVTYNLLNGAGATVDNPNLPGIQPYVIVSSNGAYQFTNLPPGQYIVEQVQPSGFLSQRDWDSTTDTIGSPVDPTNTSRIDNRIPIDLAFGESETGNNFVEFQCTTTFAAWQLVNSTAGGNAANPDGDIYTNTIEYAFCLPPGSGLGDAYCIEQNITGNFDLVFERVAGGQSDVTLCLRYTDVLTTPAASWTEVTLASLSARTTITPDPSGLVETVRISNVKDLLPSTALRGFYQFAAKMDYNGDTVVDVIDYTHVSGWQKVDIEANECETYSTPFLPCPQYTGSVTSMTGLTLNLSGSAPLANFAPGSGILLAAPAKYRIEVQTGPLAGHRFDVASGGLETLTLTAESDVYTGAPFGSLLTTTPSLQTSLVGAQIMLVQYATLEETVPIASVNATNLATTADRVLYNDGIAGWQTYWAYSNGGSPIWVLEGEALVDRGSDIVAPHQGLFVHTKSQPETLYSFGMVRQSSFAQPISTATPMLGVPYPMDMTPLQMGYLPANFTGSRDPYTSDMILQWTSDGNSLTDMDGYSAYWLNKSSLRNQWSYFGDTTLVNQNNTAFIKAGRSYYYSTAVAHPSHIVPMPWVFPTRFSNLVAP